MVLLIHFKMSWYAWHKLCRSLEQMCFIELIAQFNAFGSVCWAAVDLLERMLDLDPDTRITAEEALSHEYLRQYSDPSDEPTSQPYDQSFEEKDFEVQYWKSMAFISTDIILDCIELWLCRLDDRKCTLPVIILLQLCREVLAWETASFGLTSDKLTS